MLRLLHLLASEGSRGVWYLRFVRLPDTLDTHYGQGNKGPLQYVEKEAVSTTRQHR